MKAIEKMAREVNASAQSMFTADQLAAACAEIGIPDSQFESLLIALNAK